MVDCPLYDANIAEQQGADFMDIAESVFDQFKQKLEARAIAVNKDDCHPYIAGYLLSYIHALSAKYPEVAKDLEGQIEYLDQLNK